MSRAAPRAPSPTGRHWPDPFGRLEVEPHDRLQRRQTALRRVGLVAGGVILALAALGAFGPGAFNETVREGEGVRVVYPQTWRSGSPFTLTVVLRVPTGGPAEVVLDRAYLSGMTVEAVTPAPAAEAAAEGGVRYTIAAEGSELSVAFRLRPVRPGIYRGSAAAGGAAAHFRQVIFP